MAQGVKTVGGTLRRLQIDGKEYDPVGDWEVVTTFTKKNVADTTRGAVYFTEEPMPGKVSGNIKAHPSVDLDALVSADNVEILVESASGVVVRGTASYTGENTVSEGDGNYAIEFQGILRRVA